MQKALDLQNLCKKYGSKTALDNVSFTVNQGSCFGLLGPNGAGKSTTMKIITGIVENDSGSVRVLDMDTKSAGNKIKEQVGYVPQEITLYEKLSARQNLVFFGELYGVQGRDLKTRIDKVLEQVGLPDHADSLIKTFSGGMKRRINMAAALLHKPKLLILDEPTVGIDPQSRNHIFNMIKELKKDGVTVIYSTHYMEEVEALCDEIAIIDHGKVIAKGPLTDLLDKYTKNAVYVESEALVQAPVPAHASKVYAKNRGWVIETSHVLETMQDIAAQALQNGYPIKELEIVRPSLEHVFLSLTGTSLRD